MAGWGLRRLSGSHVRHLEMKSTKSSSSHFKTAARDLVEGLRRLPFPLTNGRGLPVASVVDQLIPLSGTYQRRACVEKPSLRCTDRGHLALP